MKPIRSLEELERIQQEARAMIRLREGNYRARIIVAMGTCGIAAGARETLMAIMDELTRRNLNDVAISQTGCIGLCEEEPLVDVITEDGVKVTYGKVTPERGRQIVLQHVVNGNIIGDWVIRKG